jgi:hypothetical protein
LSRQSCIALLISCLLVTSCEASPSFSNPPKVGTHSFSVAVPVVKHFVKANWTPYQKTIDPVKQDLSVLTYELTGELFSSPSQAFPKNYTELEGVLTFRGNHTRTAPSFGTISGLPTSLEKAWEFQTSTSRDWGGGAGWTTFYH